MRTALLEEFQCWLWKMVTAAMCRPYREAVTGSLPADRCR